MSNNVGTWIIHTQLQNTNQRKDLDKIVNVH